MKQFSLRRTEPKKNTQRRLFVLFFLLFVFLCPPPSFAGEQVPRENQVKAALLYNFARYVEWPKEFLGGPNMPLRFGVIGEDPIVPVLKKIVARKTVGGRKLELLHFKDATAITPTHILFIGSEKQDSLEEITALLGKQSILLVGDTENFARSFGMINFVEIEKSVRFEINLKNTERAGLRISKKLLSLAVRIIEE